MKKWHIFSFVFLFFFLSLTVASAAPSFEQVFKDLKSVSARVIVQQGAFYLNVGKDEGIKPGEWWRIYTQEGQKIIDPVTGKVLGVKENPIAVAQVIKVYDNFSELKVFCLAPGCKITDAAPAKRFDGFSAYFYDLSGKAFPFYERLKAKLVNLSWKPYQQVSSRKAISRIPQALIFVADGNFLYVYSDGYTLGVYSLAMEPLASSANYPRFGRPYKLVGRLPEIVYHLEVQRFGTDSLYLAALTKKQIIIQRLKGPESFIYKYRGFGDLIHFSAGPNGLIALNIFDGKHLTSRIIKFTGHGFTQVIKDSGYILRFFDFNQDGIKETLLGQNFDSKNFFGRGVYVLKVSGDKLKRVRKLDVPSGFQIFGSFFADLDQDKVLEVGFYNYGRKLVLYKGKKLIWTSSVKFGGGVQTVFLQQSKDDLDPALKVFVWPNAEVVVWQGWPRVFLPFNESSLFGGVLGGPQRATVCAFYFSSQGYQLLFWRNSFPGAVQAVFVNRDNLYAAVVRGDLFKGEGETKIYKIPLAQFMRELNY